jgi:hypothetical protein
MPAPPLQIDYAPPARRRWRWGRVVLFIFIALALGAGIYWHKQIAHEARLWYWQRQCLNYTRPPGTPTATTQPSAANDPDYHSLSAQNQQASNLLSERWLMPACFMHFDNEWSGGNIHGIPQTLFLHERISPGGHRRLVFVESIMTNALAITAGFIPRVIVPGTPWSPARELTMANQIHFSGRYIEAQFYFGQPDPSNASHFTIDFDVKESGRHGTIDAWLNDDETVTFKLRDPATTQGL